MNKNSMIVVLGVLCSFTPASAQILQDHPDLCGRQGAYTAIPQNVSATIDKSSGTATLIVGSEHAIKLKGINQEIRELCPVGSNKLVAFGWTDVGYQVNIVDTLRSVVADSFVAYDPAMSPNSQWIAYRRFQPPQSEIKISEEYLLYDLAASPSENRHNPTPYTTDAVGWAMFPSFPGDAPVNLLDIPESNLHQWKSKSIFWSQDSQSLVFADGVGHNFSLILVLIKDNTPRAYTHPITSADLCTGTADIEPYLTLGNAAISRADGGVANVTATFTAVGSTCEPRPLNLTFNDFLPARVESYEPRKLKEPTRIDHPH